MLCFQCSAVKYRSLCSSVQAQHSQAVQSTAQQLLLELSSPSIRPRRHCERAQLRQDQTTSFLCGRDFLLFVSASEHLLVQSAGRRGAATDRDSKCGDWPSRTFLCCCWLDPLLGIVLRGRGIALSG